MRNRGTVNGIAARERKDARSAKVIRRAAKPASRRCNVQSRETRYSTAARQVGKYWQILETLKGQPPSGSKLQILNLIHLAAPMIWLR